MTYAIYLYKEGEPHDGEEFLCGPYDYEDDALTDAATLESVGTAVVLPLHATLDVLREALA